MVYIHRVLSTLLSWALTIVLFPIVLLYGLIRMLLGKPFAPPVEEHPTAEDLEMQMRVEGDAATLNVNLDRLSEEEQQDFRQVAVEKGERDFFEGRIKHGYDSKQVTSINGCPKCKAATQQMYANFVYATQKGMREMLAPAGYFCTRCPTMIVDQDLVKSGVSRGFKFRGVLGLSHPETGDFEPLKTWNGKKTVYIMDEEDESVELATIDQLPEDAVLYRPHQRPSRKNREKVRRRNKLAKQARKRNRRKK